MAKPGRVRDGTVPIEICGEALWRPGQTAPREGIVVHTVPASHGPAVPPLTVDQEAAVKRSVAAAEKAGLDAYHVEIAPDGSVAIVVAAPAGDGAGGDPYGGLLT